MAIMWITHDLGVVAELAHNINVMYAGSIIETGKIRNIYKKTRHPYTIGLLGSLPRLDDSPGDGISIHSRVCRQIYLTFQKAVLLQPVVITGLNRCLAENPPLVEIDGPDHAVACWRWEEIAGVESK